MTTHHAECSCGQLQVDADGDPVRISMCHCLACQRRTGSAFRQPGPLGERRHPWVQLPPTIEEAIV